MSTHRTLVVDGTDSYSQFAGDATLPPFRVFDVDAQEHVGPEFETRPGADLYRLRLLEE